MLATQPQPMLIPTHHDTAGLRHRWQHAFLGDGASEDSGVFGPIEPPAGAYYRGPDATAHFIPPPPHYKMHMHPQSHSQTPHHPQAQFFVQRSPESKVTQNPNVFAYGVGPTSIGPPDREGWYGARPPASESHNQHHVIHAPVPQVAAPQFNVHAPRTHGGMSNGTKPMGLASIEQQQRRVAASPNVQNLVNITGPGHMSKPRAQRFHESLEQYKFLWDRREEEDHRHGQEAKKKKWEDKENWGAGIKTEHLSFRNENRGFPSIIKPALTRKPLCNIPTQPPAPAQSDDAIAIAMMKPFAGYTAQGQPIWNPPQPMYPAFSKASEYVRLGISPTAAKPRIVNVIRSPAELARRRTEDVPICGPCAGCRFLVCACRPPVTVSQARPSQLRTEAIHVAQDLKRSAEMARISEKCGYECRIGGGNPRGWTYENTGGCRLYRIGVRHLQVAAEAA